DWHCCITRSNGEREKLISKNTKRDTIGISVENVNEDVRSRTRWLRGLGQYIRVGFDIRA
ncbi:MAG: hypothetical protein II742_02850, partial [Clostridia bacterium]|nr:hypothetical protein [Clostridia bacterium]